MIVADECLVNSSADPVEFESAPFPGSTEYTSVTVIRTGDVFSVPLSRALTALENRNSSAEAAYEGIDYLREVFSGTELAATSNWNSLKMEHHTRTEWIYDHSWELT